MKMRRFKQQIPHDEAMEILKQHDTGVLSVVDADGKPYGVPLNYSLSDGKLLFHCAKQGRKTDAVKANPYGSFCVIHKDELVLETLSNNYVSVIASGSIRFVDEPVEKKEYLYKFMDSYAPRDYPPLEKEIAALFNAVAVWEMDIEEITGKESLARMMERTSKS